MKKKAFLFDLDGVIVNTVQFHYLTWRNLAKQMSFDLTEAHNEIFKGATRIRSLEILLDLAKYTATDGQKQEWLIQKNKEFLTYVEQMGTKDILPDVIRVLDFLNSKQQGIAIGSASQNARTILKRLDLIDKFHIIVDGNDVTVPKPDPQVFLKGSKALYINPENCIVFEDAIAGVRAANKAGMLSIGIGDKDVLREANYVFGDFIEISNDFLIDLIER